MSSSTSLTKIKVSKSQLLHSSSSYILLHPRFSTLQDSQTIAKILTSTSLPTSIILLRTTPNSRVPQSHQTTITISNHDWSGNFWYRFCHHLHNSRARRYLLGDHEEGRLGCYTMIVSRGISDRIISIEVRKALLVLSGADFHWPLTLFAHLQRVTESKLDALEWYRSDLMLAYYYSIP